MCVCRIFDFYVLQVCCVGQSVSVWINKCLKLWLIFFLIKLDTLNEKHKKERLFVRKKSKFNWNWYSVIGNMLKICENAEKRNEKLCGNKAKQKNVYNEKWLFDQFLLLRLFPIHVEWGKNILCVWAFFYAFLFIYIFIIYLYRYTLIFMFCVCYVSWFTQWAYLLGRKVERKFIGVYAVYWVVTRHLSNYIRIFLTIVFSITH